MATFFNSVRRNIMLLVYFIAMCLKKKGTINMHLFKLLERE